ncbi:MAG: glycoside hydrolase family 92 protein [Verrucomicrobia bacterium]|jgi:predicted alpha-1,2-mannosidase|nr:glycoside hydrolase family 92 protein [Verrucomicrobiota bacterium]MBT7067462.1 glycoside hydrolase family 92 protein [Verrucomicrobiota bacterium]MBT7701270.1 glycoside hydrolase family 92 protein [Verrucomicrobiota bacterium]
MTSRPKIEPLRAQQIQPDTGTRCEGHMYARTYPGPSWPFGMVQPGPDNITGWDYTNGYSYDLRYIEGFSMMRMSGMGWYGDFGNLQVMPTTGPLQTYRGLANQTRAIYSGNGWHSPFLHRDESILPGYYGVLLHRYNIHAELTATRHCGMMRFTFPKDEQSRIQVDLARRIGGTSSEQDVRVVNDSAIEGWVRCGPEGGGMGNGVPKDLKYKLFFRAEFSRPLTSCGIWEVNFPEGVKRDLTYIKGTEYAEYCRNATVHPGRREAHGEHLGFYTEFPTEKDEQVLLKIGLSFVDAEGARNNLATELDHWEFDRARNELVAAWDQALSGLAIGGANSEDKSIAATAAYHVQLDPRRIDDCDGRYVDGKGRTRPLPSYKPRTVFSGWDAFRSYFPLMTLMDPELVNDQVNVLLDVSKTTNKGLPKWELMGIDVECMVGDPAVGTIVDAYLKGIRDFDVDLAFELCKETAFGPRTHRDDWKRYRELGYCPGNVSTTLENCYFDWCICRFAKALGRESEVAELFPSLQNYRNIYSPEVGLMRAKDEAGNWHPWEGGTTFGQGCVESNPLQQTWFVPHDPVGLMELMGEERFFATLEDMFERTPDSCFWNPYYNHSNEPVHQLVYIFACTGRPWLTQKWCRRVLKNAYGLGPEGLCGNDDVGQMSAWYLLSSMGIHPFCTASNIYCIGSPLFPEMELKLNSKYHQGDTLRIVAHDNTDENVYIQQATLGGNALNRAWVTYDELTSGDVLEFQMGPQPNREWGSAKEQWPDVRLSL